MKVDVICYCFCFFVILYPIIKNCLDIVRVKHIIKKLIGIIICLLEIVLIGSFLHTLVIKDITATYVFFSFIFGSVLGIISTYIKNYKQRKVLYEIILKRRLHKGFSNELVEILWGIITCAIEEIVWRGMIQCHIFDKQYLLSLLLTSILFTVSHIRSKISYSNMLELFVLSVILGTVYRYSQNLIYCFIIHWTRNSILIILAYRVNQYYN